MRPIVHGLEDIYGDDMGFIEVDAADGDDGETAFEQSNLPGHPSYLIVEPDGSEVWRGFGEQSLGRLDEAIQDALWIYGCPAKASVLSRCMARSSSPHHVLR